jgi:hypothetical protein
VNYLRTLNRQRKRIVLGIIKIGLAYEAKKVYMTVYWHARYDGMVNIIESLPVKTLTKEKFNLENCFIFGGDTVGTLSVRTPERTLWETAVFARRKSGKIFIRFE